MGRRSFSIKDKLAIIRDVRFGLARGQSLTSLSTELGFDRKSIRRWLKNEVAYKNAGSGLYRQIHSGRKSCLEPIKAELLQYIAQLRERAMPVSISLVAKKAATLLPPFRRKNCRAQAAVVSRFVWANNIVNRTVTRKMKESPEDLEETARGFVRRIRADCLESSNRHPDWVLNMDQTPIWSMIAPSRTLERVGFKCVKIKMAPGTKS